MTRSVKQLLYGIFYLAIVAIIGVGVKVHYFSPAIASCFDHIQNQDEQGVDCAGLCGNICTGNLQAIENSDVLMFRNDGNSATFLTEISNPNNDVGARVFPYQFEITDATMENTEKLASGNVTLYPGEARYVVVPNYPLSNRETVANLKTNFIVATSGIVWTPSSTMGFMPAFTMSDIATTAVASGTVSVVGTLHNAEGVVFRNVEIVVVFRDKNKKPIGATHTFIDQISARGMAEFSLIYPGIVDADPRNMTIEAYGTRPE